MRALHLLTLALIVAALPAGAQGVLKGIVMADSASVPIEETNPEAVNPRMAGFNDRMKLGMGRFLVNADLRKLDHTTLEEVGRTLGRFDLSTVKVQELGAIEFYSGSSQTPLTFEKGTAMCGALVLWSRTQP